jgi:hypothetical protein
VANLRSTGEINGHDQSRVILLGRTTLLTRRDIQGRQAVSSPAYILASAQNIQRAGMDREQRDTPGSLALASWEEGADLDKDIGEGWRGGRMAVNERGIDTEMALRQGGEVSCGVAGFSRAITGMSLERVAMAKVLARCGWP